MADFTVKITKSSNLLLDEYSVNKPLMFDTETEGVYGRIRLAQFYQDGWDYPIVWEFPDLIELVSLLKNWHIVCHNASYDISTIQDNLNKARFVPDNLDDTLFLSRLYYYNKTKFSLDNCLQYCLGYDPYTSLGLDKSSLQKSKWSSSLSEEQYVYAAADVYYLQKLWDVVGGLTKNINYKLDINTLKYFLTFQVNGMPFSETIVNEKIAANTKEVGKINLPINCNSPKQVRAYIGNDLSNDLGLAYNISRGNTRAADVRQTRKLLKQTSFLNKWIKTQVDGKVFGKFNPSARSGRSTCKDQNLQQLPRQLKMCFEAPDNHVMVYSDFSQLELRCVCAVTGDSTMERLFRQGKDIHQYVADMLKVDRQIAKSANFGLLYGMGAARFSDYLLQNTGRSLSVDDCADIKRKWLSIFYDISHWQKRGINDWKAGKPWKTPLGRKYTAEQMTDQLNIQIQGMGAEVAKLANHYMNKKFTSLNKYKNNFQDWQVNFIHDSYIFILPRQEPIYKEVSRIIAMSMQKAWKEMSKACKINDLPMPVKVDVGKNLGDIEGARENIYLTVELK